MSSQNEYSTLDEDSEWEDREHDTKSMEFEHLREKITDEFHIRLSDLENERQHVKREFSELLDNEATAGCLSRQDQER